MNRSGVGKNKFLIIIPAYNEEDTIEELVERAKKYADVCVVNDCSKDSTPRILDRIKGIHVIHHKKNTHIPGAVLDGMRYAIKNGYSYAITMDAGLSHNPDEISTFINARPSDLVIGTRITKINTPLYRRSLSLAGNYIYNACLDFPKSIFYRRYYYKDITSGYRRYSDKAMKLLLSKEMESISYDFLIESAMYICKNKLTMSEVPITYRFTGSSLRLKVVMNCIAMCLKIILKGKR